MSGQGGFQPAGLKRRAAARAVDTAVTVVLAVVAVMVAGFAAAVVTMLVTGFSGSDESTLYVWMGLLSALALIPVVRYEVAATARQGQTLGKRRLGLRVVVWDEDTAAPAADAEGIDSRRSIERWAVPHGSGLLAGVVAGAAAAPAIGAYGILVGADAWLVVSAIVYLSALGDPDRRGWHDKAAGTAVVETTPPDRGEPRAPAAARPVRRGVVAMVMAAAVAGGVLAGAVGFVAIESVLGLFGSEIDEYDEAIDKYDEATRQLRNYGQSVGPDGDACWPEDTQSGRTLFCDLKSIGGLHWDTGDVRVRASGYYTHIGSGYMCLLDKDTAPWCWEWSPDVQPRPARVPEGAMFRLLLGGGGFVCGETRGHKSVVCWTVGVDSPEYRQATHRFTDGAEWHMTEAHDDHPPRFSAHQTDTGEGETFDAFTGEQLTGLVQEPRVLQTTPW